MRPVALTVALAVSLLTGCGDATGPEAIAGHYILRSINGQDLPFLIIQTLPDKVVLTAGSVRINSDNTYRTRLTAVTTVGPPTPSETETSVGTYTLTGTSITFTEVRDVFTEVGQPFTEVGDTFTGSITGNTLTIIDEGLTSVFQK